MNLKHIRGGLAICGGILVHLTLGTLYTYGNLAPYVTSYIRKRSTPSDLNYGTSVWIFSLAVMGQGATMFIGGLMEKKLGPRLATLLGGWILSFGMFMTYFAIQHSFAATVITYGLIFGFGIGIAYAIPMGCAMRWFPNYKGLVNGMVVAGFGGGAFIFNEIQTAFLNPNNLVPDEEDAGEMYFTQPELLDKVPSVFLLLGGCYAGMQLIGSMLLGNPPDSVSDDDKEPMLKESTAMSSRNTHPLKILKTKSFIILWIVFFCNGTGIVFISTLYKSYGQTFIADDQFLALAGAFASVFNAGGRIIWGHMADRYSFKIVMMITSAGFAVFILTFGVSSLQGKTVYFIYVCLIFLMFSGNFALFPTAIAKTFGSKYYAINYGLLFTSQIVTGIAGGVITTILSELIGYYGLFFITAGLTFIGILVMIPFNEKNEKGKDI